MPSQPKVEAELLKLLAFNSRPLSTIEIYRPLADTFELTALQGAARRRATRLGPAWSWLVRRSMQRLETGGSAYRPARAAWVITEKGRSHQQLRQHGPRTSSPKRKASEGFTSRDAKGRQNQFGPIAALNVSGEPLMSCSIHPMIGFYRDRHCNTGLEEVGSHGLRRHDS
jgi:hypothetical protein